jgi:hypothetical protein
MPRAQAFIPLAAGLDQKLDERLRGPEQLATATNAYYRRGGALAKRAGFTPLATTGYVHDGASQGLLSSGDELLIRGYRRLWAYQEGNATVAPLWANRGDLSAFTGEQRTVFTDSLSYPTSDSCITGGYRLHAASTFSYVGSTSAAGYNSSAVYKIETEQAPIEVLKTTTISSGTSATDAEIGSVRTVPALSFVNEPIAFIGTITSSTTRLDWYRWLSTTPTAPLGLPVVSHTDVYTPMFASNIRRYDSAPMSAGQWVYAYVGQDPIGFRYIYVARMNDTFTLLSLVIPSPGADLWIHCAISYGVGSNQIYVVGVTQSGVVRLLIYTPAFGLVSNTAVFAAPPATTSCTGASVSEGTAEGLLTVAVAANYSTAAGLAFFRNVSVCGCTTAGAPTIERVIRNTTALSKVWFYNDRAYMAAFVAHGQGTPSNTTGYVNGFSGEVVFDLFNSAGAPIRRTNPRLAARYNFGVAPADVTGIEFVSGSFQTVQAGTSNPSVYTYATRRVVQDVGIFSSLTADVISFDYAGRVTQDATTRGSVTLGGASVGWYTGQGVQDLGFASAPILAQVTAVFDPAGGLAAGQTYTYLGVFESYDEKGNITRSTPGPPVAITMGAGPTNRADVTFRTIGPSARYGASKRFSVILYRADQDGLFQRCTTPLANTFDNELSQTFSIISDYGQQFDALYTQSGAEVEASGPDGAAFVMVGTKRVWLAGFFRRDRIQYSKLYNPATANETTIAPEFNDAFSFLIPGGDPVTGLGEMDDKVIVFTRSKIYAISGNGPDDGGRSNDFSGLQLVSTDTGCIEARSIVSTPAGVFFQTLAGLFVLGRDLQINFAGESVRDITEQFPEVTSAVLVPAETQVRFTVRDSAAGAGAVLVYDFSQGAWTRWDVQRRILAPVLLDPVGACMHKDVYYILASNGIVYREDPTTHYDSTNVYVPLRIESGWLQAAQQSGWQRVRQVAASCRRMDPHNLTVSLYQEFDSTTPTQTFQWAEATISAQKLIELVVMRVRQQKCTAFKIAIEDTASAGSAVLPAVGTGYECVGFSVELAGKRGLYKPGDQQRN